MFTENKIAPCGSDCSLCKHAHKKEKPCKGCRSTDENKPEFCSTRCEIIQCEIRKNNKFQFCDECSLFPCDFCVEKETRYMSKYVLKESPFLNLKTIREKGMDSFLVEQKRLWSCDCGGVICVHNGICCRCGKNIIERMANL